MLNPYHLQVIAFALINSIAAISIYMVLASGQMSLGSAGFMSVGAYTSALLVMKAGVPMPLAIIAGGAAAGLIALVIGLPTTRLRGLYLAIVTLGFSEVIRVLFLNLKITNGALGLQNIPALGGAVQKAAFTKKLAKAIGLKANQIAGIYNILVILIIMLVIIWAWNQLSRSKFGRAFRAIKEDEEAAVSSGINVTNYKMLAFVLSSIVAGIAGALYAHMTNFISPNDFDFSAGINNLLYCVFGGSNVIGGSVLGAFILTLLPEILRFLADYRSMIYGILLVIMMTFRPEGIISENMVKNFRKKRKAKAQAKLEEEAK